MEVLDWEQNVDPNSMKIDLCRLNQWMIRIHEEEGYIDEWIHKCEVSAKRLTICPAEQLPKDNAAYGLIMLQGYGKLGKWDIELRL